MIISSRQKRYIILTLVSVTVGVLYSLYHILLSAWYARIGEVHLGVAPLFDGYASTIWQRLRELLDGHWRLTDVAVFEYLKGPTTLFPLLTPLLYWPLVKIGGLYGVQTLGNFIFAIAIFLLLYKISYLLTEKFSLSVVFAGIFVMIRDLPYLLLPRSIEGVKDLIKVFLPWTPNVNSIDRLNFLSMESLKPGFVIFGPFLIFLLLFLKTEKRKFALLAGIFYGLLFYTYTFFWIYATIVLGLVCLLYLYQKKIKTFLLSLLSLISGLLLSSYFWFNQWVARQLPQFNDYLARVGGLERGHQFRFSQWRWYIVAAVAMYFFYKTSKKNNRPFVVYFFGVLFVAGFVALNMQVITGINLQPDHWFLRVIFIPQGFAVLMLLNWLFDWLKNDKHRAYLVGALTVLLLSVFAGSAHAGYIEAKQRFDVFHLPQGVIESLTWLDHSIPTDAVIVTPSLYMNELFLYYTPAKVFFPEAFDTWAGEAEILERMYIADKLFGVPTPTLSQALNPAGVQTFYEEVRQPTDVNLLEYLYFQQFYSQNFDAYLSGQATNIIPPGKIEKIVADYAHYAFAAGDLNKKYRADYVYVGPLERQISSAKFDGVKTLEKVYDKDGVVIYKVNRAL